MTEAWFPSFTANQEKELARLGVTAAQIDVLRTALVSIRAMLVPPPANNEAADLLNEVQKLARKLFAKLRELGTESNKGGQNSARQHVANLLAKGYWDLRPTDEGPNIICAFCPRLEALEQAAKAASLTLQKAKPSRYKAGSPEPVRIIDESLHEGWQNEYGTPAAWGRDEADTLATIGKRLRTGKHARPYPANLEPAVSESRPFRAIVGICYAAVGRNANPERAIKAYIARQNEHRARALDAFNAGVNAIKRRTRTERTRKS